MNTCENVLSRFSFVCIDVCEQQGCNETSNVIFSVLTNIILFRIIKKNLSVIRTSSSLYWSWHFSFDFFFFSNKHSDKKIDTEDDSLTPNPWYKGHSLHFLYKEFFNQDSSKYIRVPWYTDSSVNRFRFRSESSFIFEVTACPALSLRYSLGFFCFFHSANMIVLDITSWKSVSLENERLSYQIFFFLPIPSLVIWI